MTKYEKNEFKKWNVKISLEEMQARKKLKEIKDKYLKFNGSVSCNSEMLVFEIATTDGIAKDERMTDIREYLRILESCAKKEALFDILHIY